MEWLGSDSTEAMVGKKGSYNPEHGYSNGLVGIFRAFTILQANKHILSAYLDQSQCEVLRGRYKMSKSLSLLSKNTQSS